ncbi:flagellar transcriptional regulator FlhD [Methylomonas sp. BW4-1]|uniref:flagellar transcriptional regulator FlhD n=1 Tax=Methylomonas sp. BW4-1 TaxID=3376685 RepID=UPI004042FAD2
MNENLYNLNLDYLLVAKELIAAGEDHKAVFYLGLPPDAITILRQMSIKRIRELARSDCLRFVPRINTNHWAEFMATQSVNADSSDQRAKALMMLLVNENR